MGISWSRSEETEKRARRAALMSSLGVVAGLLVVCLCATVGGITLYSRESDSAPVRLSPRDLRPGECINELPEWDLIQVVPLVPCDEPHLYEAFGRIPIFSDVIGAYPGDDYITSFANGQCQLAFEAYVGVPMGRAPLQTYIVQPDEADWGRGRRDVLCLLSHPDGEPLTEPQFNTLSRTAEINIMAAQAGECLMVPRIDAENLVTGLAETTACGQIHDLEVYAVIPIVGSQYPGMEEVAIFAEEECVSAFESYVGVPESQSSLGYDTYFPSEQGWANGDRNVVCVLLSESGERLRGSMAGTGTTSQPENTIPFTDLEVGACFDDTDYSYQLTGLVLSKPCDQPHLNELYYREELPAASDNTAPDPADLEAADANCVAAFADYVGLDYYSSVLEFYTIAPNNDEWRAGERSHLCILYEQGYTEMTGSMRNSGNATAWQNRVAGGGLVMMDEVTVGSCFNDPKNFDYSRPLRVLPCDVPHTNEVFTLVESPLTGEYPGEEALYFDGVEQCQPSFEPYVGLPYENSILEVFVLSPNESDWNNGERTQVCLVFDPVNYELTRSVRESGTAFAAPDSGVQGEEVPLTELQVGDCIEFPGNFDRSYTAIKVDCTQPHSQEVFAVSDFPAPDNAPFPDFIEIDRRVAEVCRGAFEAYVGLPYERSRLDYTYLGLSAAAWERGERNIICTLLDNSFNPLPGPMRNSGEATAFPPDTIPNATRVSLRSLSAESCFYQPADFYKSGEVLQVECANPHGYELYAVIEYPTSDAPDASYPDFTELTTFADQQCVAAFADYIGLPFGESLLGYTTDYPTQTEWANGDRRALCLIFGYNYEEFEGLLKDSRR
jgi:hypothetical protein